MTKAALRFLPDKPAHQLIRVRNALVTYGIYMYCRSFPKLSRRTLRRMAKIQLPKGYPVDVHFKPKYEPWDQRLCMIPSGDFYTAIRSGKADVVTISGSLPRGVEADYYAKITGIAENAGAKVLLDTSGASLEAALKSEIKPELVKPNLTEINGLLGTSFTTDDVDELRAALASDARFSDIPWVVVSMGAAGSVGFHNGRAFRAKTPDIPAVNATGSGDSTIAGFAHAIAAGADDETVLRTANTCGKLNAMDPMTGHLVMDRWDEVYNGVVVTEL